MKTSRSQLGSAKPSAWVTSNWCVLACLAFIACADAATVTNPIVEPPSLISPIPGVVVSNAVPLATARAASYAAGESYAYVSLPAGAVSDGVSITINNRRNGERVTTDLADGGVDPVAIAAETGDTLDLMITRLTGSPIRGQEVVKPRRPPIIVRTVPPRGKRDVPLNTRIIVVFSEPMDTSSLSAGAVQLVLDGANVSGALEFYEPNGTAIAFTPASELESGRAYAILVTTNARDLDGQTLEEEWGGDFITAAALPAIRQVVAGSDHTCALTVDGTAYCWGSNAFGQLGIGSRDHEWPHPLPTAVKTSVRFKTLTAGIVHTCGIASDGTTWCWGDNRANQSAAGATAIDVTDPALTPSRVTGAPIFTSLAAGGFHTCGLTNAGIVYCWGDNSLGQLGRGSDRSNAQWYFGFGHATPQPVAGSITFSSIAATYSSSCGVATSGVTYCWGENPYRNLGRTVSQQCRLVDVNPLDVVVEFENECSTSPVSVATRTSVSALAVDQHGVCALLTTSELECWGRLLPGPSLVPAARLTTAWPSGHATCGLNPDDSVSCWSAYPPFAEVHPLGEQALVDINTSSRHSCGLTRGPTPAAYCWGTNYSGEIGDGTTTQRDLPVAVLWPLGAIVNR